MFLKKYAPYGIAIGSFVLGILFFLVQRNWLVVRVNLFSSAQERAFAQAHQQSVVRKTINFAYWYDDRWQSEKQSLVWVSDRAALIKHIVSRWFVLLYDEHVVDARIGIESAALTDFGQTMLLSFDQSPVRGSWSIHEKWRLFQGLCKTLHNADLGITKVLFLVHQKPLADDYLDFSQPWPIEGFDAESENL